MCLRIILLSQRSNFQLDVRSDIRKHDIKITTFGDNTSTCKQQSRHCLCCDFFSLDRTCCFDNETESNKNHLQNYQIQYYKHLTYVGGRLKFENDLHPDPLVGNIGFVGGLSGETDCTLAARDAAFLRASEAF